MNTRSNVLDDQPLATREQDALERQLFVDAIVSLIHALRGTRGQTIAVEGEWGCGKTSLLAMLERELETQSSIEILHFNPWLVGSRDQLLGELLQSLLKLVAKKTLTDRAAGLEKALEDYGSLLDLTKYAAFLDPHSVALKTGFNFLKGVLGRAAARRASLSETKGRLDSELAEIEKTVVIVIDDVDRLLPVEILELLRILKAAADFPNVVYVIAWDHSYVVDSLKSLELPKPAEFLEKIVQHRMSVPVMSRHAKDALFNIHLDRVLGDLALELEQESIERLRHYYLGSIHELINTPRDYVQIVNRAQTSLEMLANEVEPADLIAMAALAHAAPSVFSYIREHPSAAVASDESTFNFEARKSEDVIDFHASALANAISLSDHPRSISKLLMQLFPRLSSLARLYGLTHKKRRDQLSHPDRLSVFFQSGTSPSDVSIGAVNGFLLRPDDRQRIASSLNALSAKSFLKTLLQTVTEGMRPVDSKGAFAQALAGLVELQSMRDVARDGLISVDAPDLALWILRPLLETEEDLKEVVASLLDADIGLSLCAKMLADLVFGSDEEKSNTPSLDSHALDKSLEDYGKRAVADADDGSLFKRTSAHLILVLLAEKCPKHCATIGSRLLEQPELADAFVLAACSSGSWDSVNGLRLSADRGRELLTAFLPEPEVLPLIEACLKRQTPDPVHAAWQTVSDGIDRYRLDGTKVNR